MVQLNKCETDPYFLQNFQCKTMFISAFWKICELKSEHEIVCFDSQGDISQVFFQVHKLVRNSYKLTHYFGKSKENTDLSRIYLALIATKHQTKSTENAPICSVLSMHHHIICHVKLHRWPLFRHFEIQINSNSTHNCGR